MAIAHNLGFPRIGLHRQMKKTVESYWRGEITKSELKQQEKLLQEKNWKLQFDAGLDFIPVGDFTWYDHVLDMSALLGVIPQRFTTSKKQVDIDTIFCMARGQSPDGQENTACEMTKWFDTNYHYIVPEFTLDQTFQIVIESFFENVDHALSLGYKIKPVLIGPLSYLYLGKCKNQIFDKLSLLDRLMPVYDEIFQRLGQRGIEWVQMDEPILVLDLSEEWRDAFTATYSRFDFSNLKCLLATYFGDLGDNLKTTCHLPVHGLHIDLCRAPKQIHAVLENLSKEKVISCGVIDGRNIWRNDLTKSLNLLTKIQKVRGDNLWVSGSCSLLHVPIDLNEEKKLEPEIKHWLSFAKQKIEEIAILTMALKHGYEDVRDFLAENAFSIRERKMSKRIHNSDVKKRIDQFHNALAKRHSEYEQRAKAQKNALNLPLLPTTTIGSFPQTKEIRKIRRDLKQGLIDEALYEEKMRQEIADVIKIQEDLGLDVLVHGEPERNDMVEYFGELLEGFAFTENGWVQSYGSRCVKPPIIYGDVSRIKPMTVIWSTFAQSLTSKWVKGMLTGPVTTLAWSFVRDDQPRKDTALQIAFALRDEVVDLESAGIAVIQIDEPAFRECLPLRRSNWQDYLDWAVTCFRVASSGVGDETQIHTHMCYSEFNDIIEAIAALDADVITLESSRSDMELLKAFEHFAYPNEIGPGVYDIHSPRVPDSNEIESLLKKALNYITIERLWVNPDCGLKTRGWQEVRSALINMVKAAKNLRKISVEEESIATSTM